MGCHGVLEAERSNPQLFKVDIIMKLDFKKASYSDSICDTVDYTSVYNDVRDLVENKSFHLLEALGAHIADKIINTYDIKEVEVAVYKPQPPGIKQIDYFAVIVQRSKNK